MYAIPYLTLLLIVINGQAPAKTYVHEGPRGGLS